MNNMSLCMDTPLSPVTPRKAFCVSFAVSVSEEGISSDLSASGCGDTYDGSSWRALPTQTIANRIDNHGEHSEINNSCFQIVLYGVTQAFFFDI